MVQENTAGPRLGIPSCGRLSQSKLLCEPNWRKVLRSPKWRLWVFIAGLRGHVVKLKDRDSALPGSNARIRTSGWSHIKPDSSPFHIWNFSAMGWVAPELLTWVGAVEWPPARNVLRGASD